MKNVLLLIVSLFCFFSVSAQQSSGQYVVVLSLDGFRADYLEKYDAKNLLGIAEKGVRVKRMRPSNPTKTFPNHYTLATGLYPEHHGLIGNTFYAPDLKRLYRVRDRKSVENGDFYGGEPIWNTAHKAGLKTASYYWIGSEAKIKGIQPDIWKKYNDKIPFESRIDTVVSWLQLPISERPRLIMMYYHEPDHSGHHFGPNSKEVQQQVKYVDEQVGNLYRKLMKLPIADSLNFIVLSDHGMRAITSHKQIILEDHLSRNWIEGIYGSNPVYTATAKPDKYDLVYGALKKIKHLKVYKRGHAPKRLQFGNNMRVGDFFIVGKKGWAVFVNRPKKSRFHGGTHGYLNTDREMAALFVAKGVAFKSGYTKRQIKNVDVYNLLCKILDISPAPNDGKKRRIESLLRR